MRPVGALPILFMALGLGCGRTNDDVPDAAPHANGHDATVGARDRIGRWGRLGGRRRRRTRSGDAAVNPPVDAGGDGWPDDGGTDDATAGLDGEGGCGLGEVTFHLDATGEDWWAANCLGGDTGCFWLALSNSDGAALDLASPDSILVDCRGCTERAQAIGCGYVPLGDAGMSGTWNGEYFAVSTCGSASSTCAAPICAPPGQYVATMCVVTAPFSGTGTKDCVQVPFTYPSAATVAGTLPNGDF